MGNDYEIMINDTNIMLLDGKFRQHQLSDNMYKYQRILLLQFTKQEWIYGNA